MNRRASQLIWLIAGIAAIPLCGCMSSWLHQSAQWSGATSKSNGASDESVKDRSGGSDAKPSRYSQSGSAPAAASANSPKSLSLSSDQAEKLAQAVALVEGLQSSGNLDAETTQQLKAEIKKLSPAATEPRKVAKAEPVDSLSELADDVVDEKALPVRRASHVDQSVAKLRTGKIEESNSLVVEVTDPPEEKAAQRASHEEPLSSSSSWDEDLTSSIARLELETQELPASAEAVNRHAALRMLYLLAGRRADALKPIPGISPSQQDFWREELYGLATLMDADNNPDSARRSAEGTQHLRLATAKLSETSNLTLRNMSICSEVNGFGNYRPFGKYRFKPGQSLLVYVEVENFRVESRDDQFKIAVKGSYQIRDKSGERIASQDYPTSEDSCQNARRDLYLMYPVDLPTRLSAGVYTLELSVEDALSHKLGQSSLEFTVDAN